MEQPEQSIPALQQTLNQPATQTQSTSSTQSGHLMQNQAGQIVYVSTHPTLGNVGPMVNNIHYLENKKGSVAFSFFSWASRA